VGNEPPKTGAYYSQWFPTKLTNPRSRYNSGGHAVA
jgi:hypothetical protein